MNRATLAVLVLVAACTPTEPLPDRAEPCKVITVITMQKRTGQVDTVGVIYAKTFHCTIPADSTRGGSH